MASKRRRKLERKASQEGDERIAARREAFNDNLWKIGVPVVVSVILVTVIYFGFFYELGAPSADSWNLEEAETGEMYYWNVETDETSWVFLAEEIHLESSATQRNTLVSISDDG